MVGLTTLVQIILLGRFQVGVWLTHGDFASGTATDFLSSVWAPANQESSDGGAAGVGVVSLCGAPKGRALMCILPVGSSRVTHRIVAECGQVFGVAWPY